MYDAPMFAPQGWQCPVCGRVYAPSWPFCTVCGNQESVTTTNVTTNVDKPIDERVKEWKKILDKILDKAEVEPWYINSMLEKPYGVDDADEKRAHIEDLINGVPTVPAVPLEPLCHWLANHFQPPVNMTEDWEQMEPDARATIWRWVLEKGLEEQDAHEQQAGK